MALDSWNNSRLKLCNYVTGKKRTRTWYNPNAATPGLTKTSRMSDLTEAMRLAPGTTGIDVLFATKVSRPTILWLESPTTTFTAGTARLAEL